MTATELCGQRVERGGRPSSLSVQKQPQETNKRSSKGMLRWVTIMLLLVFFVPNRTQEVRTEVMEEAASSAGVGVIGRPHVLGDNRVQLVQRRQQPKEVKCFDVCSSMFYSRNERICERSDDQAVVIVDEYCEYEERGGLPGIKVGGRLKDNFLFWEHIGAPTFILDTIRIGYVIPFTCRPSNMYSDNNKSALNNKVFVREAITELTNLGTVERCNVQPAVVNPLTVSVQGNGKKRLILDLRLVNQCLEKVSVKYEDMRTALLFLKQGGFVFKFDLKSGYHHIDICDSHRDFLGFSWSMDDTVSTFYRFKQLPFGLSSAPYIFTKVVRPLVKKWRGEGKSIVVFLDDGLGFAETYAEALRVSSEVKADLIASGFVPNVQKSIWIPVQKIEWLGFDIDLEDGSFTVPGRRVVSIIEGIDDIVHRNNVSIVTARLVARVVGKIMSTNLVTGNMSRIMTKSLQVCIESRSGWDKPLILSQEAVHELHFWRENVSNLNRAKLGPRVECSRIVYSDASNTGFGGTIVNMADTVAHGLWDNSESLRSSAWRELKAVELILNSLSHELSNRRVKWFTDNQSVERIAVQGSMKEDLQKIAVSICRSCLQRNIHLEMEWVPRMENERADKLSRFIDNDDWSISDDCFQYFDELWGPHSVDRFASYYNKKIGRFNSRFWNPGSEAIDTFTVKWSNENNWVVPPISLISRVVVFMKQTRVYGTLICPRWISAPYWPLLFPDGCNPIRAVVDIQEIPCYSGVLLPGRGGNEGFVETMQRSAILVLRLDFRC